jgi:hypothetical protein
VGPAGPSIYKGASSQPTFAGRFPSESEKRKLAKIAKVKNEKYFCGGIDGLILDTWGKQQLYHDKSKMRRAVRRLEQLNTSLQNASSEFEKIFDARGNNSADAECIFAHHILKEASAEHDGSPNLSDLESEIRRLSEISDRAHRRAKQEWRRKGRPVGSGGNAAFNYFIEQLYINVWTGEGELTNFRNRADRWSGSLHQALDILQQYLPTNFTRSGRGRAAKHIVDKLKKHMKAKRSEYRRRRHK